MGLDTTGLIGGNQVAENELRQENEKLRRENASLRDEISEARVTTTRHVISISELNERIALLTRANSTLEVQLKAAREHSEQLHKNQVQGISPQPPVSEPKIETVEIQSTAPSSAE